MGGDTVLHMPRPDEMNIRTGEYQTTRLDQPSVEFNHVFAVNSQAKSPGSEETSSQLIRSKQGQHGAD